MSPIKRIRTQVFDATQAEFAAIAGVTQPTVSRWEAESDNSEPTLAEMAAIRAEALRRRKRWSDRWFFRGAGARGVRLVRDSHRRAHQPDGGRLGRLQDGVGNRAQSEW
jgi:transcriptional regulator with XRE-family HTH domain